MPNDDHLSNDLKHVEIGTGFLPAWKWTGADVPELLYEINESCLAALQKGAQGYVKDPASHPFNIVKLHQHLWLDLNELALRRAARVPCLLVDVHFQSEEWWRWARSHRAKSSKSERALAAFAPKVARNLMVETLVLAWHTARSDRPTATLLLGIAPVVADRIAELSSRDVRRIAAEHCRELKPRFEGNGIFWQRLLLAARSGDAQTLVQVYREGIQLLATEVLPGVR